MLPAMSTSEARPATTDRLTRATQIALIVNALLHSMGMVGFFIGLDPHSATLARRAAAAGLAGVVCSRLRVPAGPDDQPSRSRPSKYRPVSRACGFSGRG